MKTISAEQFKKQYGDEVVQKFNAQPAGPQKPDTSVGFAGTKMVGEGLGLLSEHKIIKDSSKQGDVIQQELDKRLADGRLTPERHAALSEGLQPDISGVIPKRTTGDVVRGGIKAGTDIASLTIGGGGLEDLAANTAKGAIGKGFLGGAVSGMVSGGIQGAGQGLEDTHSLSGTVKGGLKGAAVGGAVGGALGTIAPAVTKGADAAADFTSGAASKVGGEEDLLTGATRHVTPDYESSTPTQKMKMQNQIVRNPDGTSQPRITEGNDIGPTNVKGYRSVTNTAAEKASANELSKLPGYKSNMTNLEAHNLIKESIATEAQTLRKSLQAEGQAIPKKEIVSTVQKSLKGMSKDSLLLQKSDPILNNYMRVVKTAVDQAPGTLEGVLDVRQALDTAYENARGRLAFGSDKMSALDEIHTAARDSLNDYAIKNARNTDVKASFKKQASLYRADDVINAKAAREGSSSIERVENKIKKSPLGRTVSKMPVVGKYLR